MNKKTELILAILAFLLSVQCFAFPNKIDVTTIYIFGLIFLTYGFTHLAKYLRIKK